MIDRLKRVPLREVWKHEAYDFTTWLEGNLEVLSEAIELSLTNVEREKAAGDFSIDLVAEDESGNAIVIENQLEKSDHDHLGKVITYLSAMGAKAAVWIVANPRPEHIQAVTWLNECSSADFYLLKVEAVKIGESNPAPLLTKIVGPSSASKLIGETKKELKERHHLRFRFWSALLELAKSKTKLHTNISPTRESWISASAGLSGLAFTYTALKDRTGVELYIGRDSELENQAIFESLLASKTEIEERFGSPLEWQDLPGRKACRIYAALELGGYRDEETWPKIQEGMIDTMIRLEKAIRPNLNGAMEVLKKVPAAY